MNTTMISLLENMPGMTFIKDAKTGVYLACNQAFAAYAHKETPRGVEGLTDEEIFDPVTAAHFVEDDRIALSMDKPYIFYEDVMDAGGSPRQFQTTKMKYTDSEGRKCLLGMCQDVTDMVRIRRENASTKEAYEKARNRSVIYNHLAHALARDYLDLFYVNMETNELIEFHTDDSRGVLTEARQSADFFEGCERDAKIVLHPADREKFIKAMNREFLKKAFSVSKVFEMTYRVRKEESYAYVNMQVTQMEDDPRIIVIAVSDIEELMRQRREEERIREERIVYARLHALTGNFLCVYVVDPETENYHEFSATANYTENFSQSKDGTDFFGTVRQVAHLFNHPDDLKLFLSLFTKENVLAEIANCGIFTMDYRVMMEGKPLHVQMKAAMVEEKDGPRLIVGLNDVDAQFRQKEIEREIARQKDIYDQITGSLAEQYDTLYYIDLETSTYNEISSTDEYKKLNVPATGKDFFAESRRSIRKYVHPEDQEKALNYHYKDVMLENLKSRNSFSLSYRLVVDGRVRHIRHTEILARDRKHLIVCIENIDAEVKAQQELKATQMKSVTYTQIAERLASHYDLIYYIDCDSLHYDEYSTKQKSGELKVQSSGKNFFAASRKNVDRLIYSEDRERIRLFLDRDHLISSLENQRQLVEDYRMNIAGGKTQYTRMSVTYSSDHTHFIICVENRDEDVKKEQEQLAALKMANEMARRDGLTHTKNKTAYHEMEKELQSQIDQGNIAFGLVVCDINGLKVINDTEGHKAGDEYIKTACSLICHIFSHSPVFRIGGDEFVVILRGQNYEARESLLSRLRRQVEENSRIGEGPVVASGLAVYRSYEDPSVEAVFNRADSLMYENKTALKEQKRLRESHSLKGKAVIRSITEERRIILDSLFKSFEVVAEGTYVFLCDMKYDFSRWSKSAVDIFGLPSEYMYGAGDIWESWIHPEDRAVYHKGIDDLFSGSASGHDMQYRARRVTGEYDVCTCRGIVIRDLAGEPDYFAGTIRNHGMQGHIDTLTGLRNQYGFFEDLEGCIKRNTGVSVCLFGISRFTEINEIYGYNFGNRVLQIYARRVFEKVGNAGHTYRLDGTKFAVISNTLSIAEMREKYNRFRDYLHDGFEVDDKKLLLDLHCGALRLHHFDIDSQTAYACLNYADEESKLRRQGDMVEFNNDAGENSHERLERLHAIRLSITHGFEGFYLLFQPVVDARTERLIGAEALLRWKNDQYGMVPPDEFIPILETDPLFPELGEWILRESILASKEILKDRPDFVINVNLSYAQMEKPGFTDMVFRILDDQGFPPEHLCLEVTERCRLLDLKLLKDVIDRLRDGGILIALDDFGTGFSAVGLLKEIPFDIIKIDRSFVQAIEEKEIDRQLIRNIVELAAIFGAKVCVEGIETPGMRDILQIYRVGSFQGYYYSKPIPPEELLDLKKQPHE